MKKGNIKSLVAMLCVTAVGIVPVFANAFNEASTSTSASASVSEKEYKLGDVDMNGIVNLDDARLVLGVALAIDTEEYQAIAKDEQKSKLADMNKDGNVTLHDAELALLAALAIER